VRLVRPSARNSWLAPGSVGMLGAVLVVHVHVSVQPDRVDEFLAATDRNARASLEEPGVVRFDVLQDQADPTHVVLVEVYRDEGAAAAHKETSHYATWRDAVADLMARPRESMKFAAVFPTADNQWAALR
jgi:(4S)-4-hydroxy-5-phosphonooxypentane-2,3-dione isomerase